MLEPLLKKFRSLLKVCLEGNRLFLLLREFYPFFVSFGYRNPYPFQRPFVWRHSPILCKGPEGIPILHSEIESLESLRDAQMETSSRVSLPQVLLAKTNDLMNYNSLHQKHIFNRTLRIFLRNMAFVIGRSCFFLPAWNSRLPFLQSLSFRIVAMLPFRKP